jgi:hypothetical protein
LIKYAEKKTTLLQVKRMLRKLRYSTKWIKICYN